MEYRYNAERDRLERAAYNPSFAKAVYRNHTSERTGYFWTCTSNLKNIRCTAESYARDDEEMIDVNPITQKEFMQWLFKGTESYIIHDTQIPAAFVLQFMIAQDQPGPLPEQRKGKYGDLSEYKQKLEKMDKDFLQKIFMSYRASRPEADIVRKAPDVDIKALRPVTKLLAEHGAIPDFYSSEEERE